MAERPTQAEIEARSARNRAAWRDTPHSGRTLGAVAARKAEVAKPDKARSQRPPVKPSGRFRGRSSPDYEAMLAGQLTAAGILTWVRQYPFAPDRKYRADFFFPDHNLIVEVEGQAHSIKGRWKDGILRDQVIFGLGFRLLKVGTWQVRSGAAVTLIERALR